LSEAKTFDSSYLIYLEAMMTSKVYARDITTVNPLVLALFASKLNLFHNVGVIVIDSWIGFKASASLIEVLVLLRQELEDAFVEKVVDPSSENNDKLKRVLCLIELIVLKDINNFKIALPQPPIILESNSDLPPCPPQIDQSLSNLSIKANDDLGDDKSINFICNETICSKNESTWECEKCANINVSSHSRCNKCSFVIKIEVNTPFHINNRNCSTNTISNSGNNNYNNRGSSGRRGKGNSNVNNNNNKNNNNNNNNNNYNNNNYNNNNNNNNNSSTTTNNNNKNINNNINYNNNNNNKINTSNNTTSNNYSNNKNNNKNNNTNNNITTTNNNKNNTTNNTTTTNNISSGRGGN
jgi:hypothetical protein